MKNLNNKIILTTYITYKNIEKKMKKQGHWVKAKDAYCKWRCKVKMKNKNWK